MGSVIRVPSVILADPGGNHPMAGMGHGPALLSTEASGRCRFTQATFARARGKGRDAPKAVT
jgi:hypothetical protein